MDKGDIKLSLEKILLRRKRLRLCPRSVRILDISRNRAWQFVDLAIDMHAYFPDNFQTLYRRLGEPGEGSAKDNTREING
jgi:hypothetical protein